MDVTQSLKDAENALRDFIAATLKKSLGENWIRESGISLERIKKWDERKQAEDQRQSSGAIEERLIYYADFYDLRTLLKKHWSGEFSTALGDWKTMEVFLNELEKLRDPDAHRRELLPHQKHLVIGISGEIRNRLVRYRSKQETEEDYYPRIESARDSLGHIWTPERGGSFPRIFTDQRLRPGDQVDYVVTATDPLGEALNYGVQIGFSSEIVWQKDNEFSIRIEEEHVGNTFPVTLFVKSSRKYHAESFYDAQVSFTYSVLPPLT